VQAKRDAVKARLAAISIPVLELKEASVEDAVTIVTDAAKAADAKGVGVEVTLSKEARNKVKDTRLTLTLRNVPVKEVILYLVNLAGLKHRVTETGVELMDTNEVAIETEVFRNVGPAFFQDMGLPEPDQWEKAGALTSTPLSEHVTVEYTAATQELKVMGQQADVNFIKFTLAEWTRKGKAGK
jgi:hypothetical protein